MQAFFTRRRAVLAAFAISTCTTMVAQTNAQSAGNPKGTMAPTETSAPRAGSSFTPVHPAYGGVDSGKLTGNEAQARARLQSSVPRGSGTEGGLPSKRQGEVKGDKGAQSDNGSAFSKPVPPSQ